MEAPVLLITFNRPETTRVVLDALRNAQIKTLYIFNDGPRPGIESDNYYRKEIQKLISDIDWDCRLYTLFSETNLGCGPGPVAAISWAFTNEDRLIILEDDCVPAISFFEYCNELLERYKDDARIWRISGDNYSEEFPVETSYIFSFFGHSLGWATWKRCWENYDFYMDLLPDFENSDGFYNYFADKKMARYFSNSLWIIYKNSNLRSHIWDYQSLFTIYSNFGLSIVPQKNLTSNIGTYGTHASSDLQYYFQGKDESFKIISHPKFIVPNRKYDQYHFEKVINKKISFFLKVVKKSTKLLKHFMS